jgi:predicted nucleic acid-binding protein
MSDVAIDACCLLNLIAAGNILPKIEEAETASTSFPHVLHVPDIVEGEALYVYESDEDDAETLVKRNLDIRAMIDVCILQGCTLQSGEESELFVRLAVRLDDGEAACLAMAKNRSWTLASDDRVARKLSSELDVSTLGTAELVKSWAEESNASDEDVRVSLTNIQRFARFLPRTGSPESDWWFQHAK